MTQTRQTSNAQVNKAVTASVVGTIIEWFDYALYGTAASLIINKIFFPDLSDTAGILAAFATFAVGFFVRPLGGVVIAHIGDRFGRKPALIFSITLMGAGTVAIGLLPTYAQIGIMAPILLVIMRMAQGFGAGAEYAGAVTLVYEYAPRHLRGFYTALLQSATLVGILLAILTFLGVSQLPDEIMASWGWRVPFLLSAVLFVVALYIRKKLDETPEYLQAVEKAKAEKREHKLPLGQLIKRYPRQLFHGFLAITGHNANAYILSAFCLSYMTNNLGISRTSALQITLIASLCGVITTPFMGWLADRFGAARIYILGAAFGALFAYPLFLALDSGSLVIAALAMSLAFAVAFGGMAGAQGVMLANMFPTEFRFSGISVSRELNSMLIAGPTPFICTLLVGVAGGSSTYVAAYLAACCLITIYAVLKLNTNHNLRIEATV